MSALAPQVPGVRARISTSALIDCMSRAGYSIGIAAFNEIEHGTNVPRDAMEFLSAVSTCLQLSTEDREDLEMRLASDILYARFGDRADYFIPVRKEWCE